MIKTFYHCRAFFTWRSKSRQDTGRTTLRNVTVGFVYATQSRPLLFTRVQLGPVIWIIVYDSAGPFRRNEIRRPVDPTPSRRIGKYSRTYVMRRGATHVKQHSEPVSAVFVPRVFSNISTFYGKKIIILLKLWPFKVRGFISFFFFFLPRNALTLTLRAKTSPVPVFLSEVNFFFNFVVQGWLAQLFGKHFYLRYVYNG